MNIEVAFPVQVYVPVCKDSECMFKTCVGEFVAHYRGSKVNIYSKDLIVLIRDKRLVEYKALYDTLQAIACFWHGKLPMKTTDWESLSL